MRNVPVATCCTVVHELATGIEYLIIGYEMLWFGDQLGKSLLNQNQIRYAGHMVQDDPTQIQEEGFGITFTDRDVHIFFAMKGTSIYFESRTPTAHEIEALPIRALTQDQLWDPATIDMHQCAAIKMQGQVDSEVHPALADISTTLDERWFIQAITTQGMGSDHAVSSRHSAITPENLNKIWRRGLDTAKKTLRVTTQRCVRAAIHPITCRYQVDQLALHRNWLKNEFHTDTLFSRVKSLAGNKCAQVFTNGQYMTIYLIENRRQVGMTLGDFVNDVGIPDKLTADQAGEQFHCETDFMRQVRYHQIQMHLAEKGRSKQNAKAEREIGILKQQWQCCMVEHDVPRRLLDCGLKYEAEILSSIPRGQHSRLGLKILTGNSVDISEWIDFQFYDLVWYHDQPKPDASEEPRKLGWRLGVAHHVGSDLCYWILTASGKVLARTTVQHVTALETSDEDIRTHVDTFNWIVKERLDDTAVTDNDTLGPGFIEDVELVDEELRHLGQVPSDLKYSDMLVEDKPEADDHPEYDKYIGIQLSLDPAENQCMERSRNGSGTWKDNPLAGHIAIWCLIPGNTMWKWRMGPSNDIR